MRLQGSSSGGGTLAALGCVIILSLSVVPGMVLTGASMGPAEGVVACWDAGQPCWVQPGDTTEGTLVRGANDVDHYALSPPAGASVLSFTVERTRTLGAGFGLFAELEDPRGMVRDRAEGTGSLELTTVGSPEGEWRLRVGIFEQTLIEVPPWGVGPDPAYPSAYGLVDYRLSFAAEAKDHAAPLTGPSGPGPTFTAAFNGHDARVDLYYDSLTMAPGEHSWSWVIALRTDAVTTEGEEIERTVSLVTMFSRVPPSQGQLWIHGDPINELSGPVDISPPAITTDDRLFLHAGIVSDPARYETLNISLGADWSDGVRGVHGWIAWDDPAGSSSSDAPGLAFPTGGTSTFAQLSDFEGDDGLGVRAGPVSAAQDLSIQVEAPEGMVHTIFVRGQNIANHPPHARFTVEIPNGTSEVVEGETRSWSIEDVPSGTWGITMDQRAGSDLGQHWVAAASFPLAPFG